jgi:deoxyribodipyrimidine photo-lyase
MYLAHGCLTARSVLDHLRGHLRRIDASDDASDVARTRDSADLLVLHLLWRDFMHLYAVSMGPRLFHRYGRCAYRPPAAPVGDGDGDGDGDARRWELFRRWQRGQTGYPFVDASMRELLATGYMSNRGRQNVASFLVNDLRVDWRWGAAHFERHLVDYDVAANYGNWQYLAGVGSDPRTTSGAATRPPVGRYFNVAKQAMLYDPDATFMRTWCPELRPLCETQAQRCGDAAAAAVACYVDRRLLTALLQEAGADASGRRIDYPAEPIAALAHGLDPVADLLTAKDDLVRRTKRRGVKHGDIPLLAQAS